MNWRVKSLHKVHLKSSLSILSDSLGLLVLIFTLLALVMLAAPAGCFFGGPVPVSVYPPLPMSLMVSCLKEVVVLAPHQGDLL